MAESGWLVASLLAPVEEFEQGIGSLARFFA
jgi:hypothetical protein